MKKSTQCVKANFTSARSAYVSTALEENNKKDSPYVGQVMPVGLYVEF